MKLQKARKNHICDLCQRKILKGEKYWNNYHEEFLMSGKEHTNCELFNDNEHDPK